MQTIHHVTDIATDPATIYRNLTTSDGLSGWWSTVVASPEPGVGAIVAFTFMEDFNPRMEITGLEPGRLVEWTCVGGHDPWKDNTFRFSLDPRDRLTRLRFWQHYAVELGDDDFGTYNFNWGYYLHSLQLLCETGTGSPYDAG